MRVGTGSIFAKMSPRSEICKYVRERHARLQHRINALLDKQSIYNPHAPGAHRELDVWRKIESTFGDSRDKKMWRNAKQKLEENFRVLKV